VRLGTRYSPDEVAGTPELWRGDVLVVGGGSAGCATAVAAARSGARTLLVESGGFLGGTGTRVLDTFYGFYAPGAESARVVGGVGWEVCERLTARGMAFERPNTYGAGTGVTYEPEALKVVWDELVAEAGAGLLLYGLVGAVLVDESAARPDIADQPGAVVRGAVVETRAGPRLALADVVVDATGDAEVAWRAGCAVVRPRDERVVQPCTATFRMGGVAEPLASTAELHERMAAARDDGGYDLPRVEGSAHVTVLPGVRHTNMTRVSGHDVTDPWELTAAELEGRRQVGEYARFLVDRVPGYGDAYLLQASTRLGIRESRRLVGEAILGRDDVLAGAVPGDTIARCGAPIEDHAAGDATRWEYVGAGAGAGAGGGGGGSGVPTGRTYGIPYGALVPVDVDGLLVAGRCLSATHDAHASVRSMGQCMAMGHAAGVAAALAADGGLPPRSIDRARLRTALREQGGVL